VKLALGLLGRGDAVHEKRNRRIANRNREVRHLVLTPTPVMVTGVSRKIYVR
jgi:hypothetical protein